MRWRKGVLFACIVLSLNGHLLTVMGFQREFENPGAAESGALKNTPVTDLAVFAP